MNELIQSVRDNYAGQAVSNFRYQGIGLPEQVKREIDRYVLDGVPPGAFVRAVLANDLMDSFGRADEINTMCMGVIVCYVYQYVPRACKGCREEIDGWIKLHAEQRLADVAHGVQ